MMSDDLSASAFYLTQDFLAQMLGVRRNAVSETAGRLQARRLRGHSEADARLDRLQA